MCSKLCSNIVTASVPLVGGWVENSVDFLGKTLYKAQEIDGFATRVLSLEPSIKSLADNGCPNKNRRKSYLQGQIQLR